MNKASSKKIVSDAAFASYLIPAELSRFKGDIVNLTTYLTDWATKRGGKALLTDLESILASITKAENTLVGILNTTSKKGK